MGVDFYQDGQQFIATMATAAPFGDYQARAVEVIDVASGRPTKFFHMGIDGMDAAILNSVGKWTPEFVEALFQSNLVECSRSALSGGPLRPRSISGCDVYLLSIDSLM